MLINIDQMDDFIARGIMRPEVGWGDAKETACLMSSLTGETSIDGCAAKGWHKAMAELGTVIFDNAGDAWLERSRAFAHAMKSADKRGADFDDVVCRIRLKAILPIAMEAIGKGDEPWRVECRAVVQHAIDIGGKPLSDDWKVRAAEAAEAAWAAGAAKTAAHTRIFNATIEALEES